MAFAITVYIIYVCIGCIQQYVQYRMYWSRDDWNFERSFIISNQESLQVELLPSNPISHNELLNMFRYNIKLMMLMTAFIYWPLTIGRSFIKPGSLLDVRTRSAMLDAFILRQEDIMKHNMRKDLKKFLNS